MKKLYTLIAIGLVSTVAIAQNRQVNPCNSTLNKTVPFTPSQSITPPTDTLWGNLAAWTAPGCNGASGGGYVVGNNSYADKQKAQAYLNSGNITIFGCIYWFCAKEYSSGNSTSHVKMRVYRMDGTATVTTGSGPGPNTVLVSDNVPISNVDTSSMLATAYIHTYSTPVFYGQDFAVGFDVTGLAAGDTIGGVLSANNEGLLPDMSFDQWSDNLWHSLEEPGNWTTLDLVDCAMFPIVDMSSSIGENNFINGVKVATYPNPATNGNTSICYDLQNNIKNVEIKILDVTGKVIAVYNEGNKKAGSYTVSVDTKSFAAGTYFVTLSAGGNIATKLVIQ